jgi:hypothetical protein
MRVVITFCCLFFFWLSIFTFFRVGSSSNIYKSNYHTKSLFLKICIIYYDHYYLFFVSHLLFRSYAIRVFNVVEQASSSIDSGNHKFPLLFLLKHLLYLTPSTSRWSYLGGPFRTKRPLWRRLSDHSNFWICELAVVVVPIIVVVLILFISTRWLK